MFNLNWYNVVILLLLALFIFGDKLPQLIADGLRLLRNLRRMAQSATSDLGRELGTDIRLEDLHPKAFVRKHVLSEADQERLLSPLRDASDDLRRETQGLRGEFEDVGRRTERVTGDVRRAANGNRRAPAARDGGDHTPGRGSPADPPAGDGGGGQPAGEPAGDASATGAVPGRSYDEIP